MEIVEPVRTCQRRRDLSRQDLLDLSVEVAEEILREKVTVLDLSSNFLTSLCEAVVSTFSNLQSLGLAANMLTELPVGLCSLHKLQSLNLKRNRLKCIPEGFGNMKGLRELNLSGNLLHKFPIQLCALGRLEYLHLGGNSITDVPSSIKNLKS